MQAEVALESSNPDFVIVCHSVFDNTDEDIVR